MSSPAALETRRLGTLTLPRVGAQPLLTVGLAALLCAIALGADGGQRLGRSTVVEIGLVLGGGVVVAATLLMAPRGERAWGVGTLLALVALAAISALSILWAVNPAEAWVEADRTLAYTAAFAAAVALAHAVPQRWSAVLGAITLAAVVVSAYALATKVFPGALNPDEIYARLRQPFGYWNAVGLMAALGVPGCLWLGARRSGHQALNALAHPALALLLVTILLAYSRGALLAAALGAAFWFAVVPLRLRGLLVLGIGGIGAAAVTAWVFAQDPLTGDRVSIDLQAAAGHQLGLLLVVVAGLLLLAGLAVGFCGAQRPAGVTARRRAGVVALVTLALLPVGLGILLATSDDGLLGSISKGYSSLTDPSASVPANTPNRLTAVGSVRAAYWNDALKIFADHPWVGTGANGFATARLRYRSDDFDVRHAHGYVVQTAADLGIVGLLASLALLGGWLYAAARATGLRPRDRGLPYTSERIGLLTLVAVVVTFAVHSLVDWTWFVPATAVIALLAAGWVAGRGPLRDAADSRAQSGVAPRERLRAASARRVPVVAAATALIVALVGAWTVSQPQRSSSAAQDGLAALDRGAASRARERIGAAVDHNPLAVEPLFALALVEGSAGRDAAARAALVQAVRLQPSNPTPWLRLAELELFTLKRPEVALTAVRRALFLDPRSSEAIAVFLNATRQTTAS